MKNRDNHFFLMSVLFFSIVVRPALNSAHESSKTPTKHNTPITKIQLYFSSDWSFSIVLYRLFRLTPIIGTWKF